MFPNKNPTFVIPKGTKNFVLVSYGGNGLADNDIELFAIKPTKTENHIKYAQVVHLAGTELTTDAASIAMLLPGDTYVNDTFDQCWLNGQKIDTSAYDDSYLNTGPSKYDPAGNTIRFTEYNGMTIGYGGDPDHHDSVKNDGRLQDWDDYEVLVIDEVTEDLIVSIPGIAGVSFKAYWDLPDTQDGGAGVGGPMAASCPSRRRSWRRRA